MGCVVALAVLGLFLVAPPIPLRGVTHPKEIEVLSMTELKEVKKEVIGIFREHNCYPDDIGYVCLNLILSTARVVEGMEKNSGVKLVEVCIERLSDARDRASYVLGEE